MATGFHDDTDEERLDLIVDHTPVGHIDYGVDDGIATIFHTEVDPAHEGHGYAGELVAEAMRLFAERGLLVAPRCPFAQHWLKQHPELHAAVEPEWRNRLALN